MLNRWHAFAGISIFALVVTTATLPGEDDLRPELKKPLNPAVPVKVDLPPKNFTQELPGGLKIELVYVPGGEFEMGSPDDEAGRQPDEGPRRKVTVKPYWLGKYEIRWDEFDAWKANETIIEYPAKSPFPTIADALSRPTPTYEGDDYGHGHEGFPAISMSHHACMMFCHWLRSVSKLGYRLPTEAEWEFACRAGQPGPYGVPAEQLGDYCQYKANSPDDDHPKGTTLKCGSKKPNAFGLHDMNGNVWEYCLDHYDAGFYKTAAAVRPVNKPTDKKWSHTCRGGSFKDDPAKLRAAARLASEVKWMKHDPQVPRSIWWLTRMDTIGFRIALPVEEQPELVGLKPMVVKKEENDPVTDK